MIIHPEVGKQYGLAQLYKWYAESKNKGEVLEIDPCNPKDVPYLWTKAIINSTDDVATLTQWLGGIPA
jgi:hypothetical protein